jgi:signal transduction histidine kinase
VIRLRPRRVRTRLTLLYVGILALLLGVYLVLVYGFQYNDLKQLIYLDEVQDVETVEGLLAFAPDGGLHLQQGYLGNPTSHLLMDRLMEVRDLSGKVLYRSDTLHGMQLGRAKLWVNEGANSFDRRTVRLADGTLVQLISHRHFLNGHILVIRLGYSLSPLAERMKRFLFNLLLLLPIALIIAGFVGYQIARRALTPLDTMSARAEQITASNLEGRLEIEDEHDELGRMARVLNSLLSRLQGSFEQLHRFTADAAHELKTPLACMRAVGEGVLEGNATPENYRDAISSMLEETSRLNQTVEGLLILSKAEEGEIALNVVTFPLCELLDEILSLLDVILEEHNVRILQERLDDLPMLVAADRTLLRTCILNVLHNAIKFTPSGTVRLSCQHLERNGRKLICLSILDQGPGIAESDRQRVFERFFRVKSGAVSTAEGAGLGLAIAKLAIESNHGSIRFDPSGTQGALCHIEVPAAQQG